MEKDIDQGDKEEAKREEESMCVHKDSEEEEGRKKGRNYKRVYWHITDALTVHRKGGEQGRRT